MSQPSLVGAEKQILLAYLNAQRRHVLDLYREQIERAYAVIAATPLVAAPAWWSSPVAILAS